MRGTYNSSPLFVGWLTALAVAMTKIGHGFSTISNRPVDIRHEEYIEAQT